MKKLLLILMLIPLFVLASPYPTADKPVYVHPYVRKNGEYVEPYWRSKPHHRYPRQYHNHYYCHDIWCENPQDAPTAFDSFYEHSKRMQELQR